MADAAAKIAVDYATYLVESLRDEVGREVLLELFLVLEGIVQLRVWHRPGLEPAVEHLARDAFGDHRQTVYTYVTTGLMGQDVGSFETFVQGSLKCGEPRTGTQTDNKTRNKYNLCHNRNDQRQATRDELKSSTCTSVFPSLKRNHGERPKRKNSVGVET